MSMPNKNLKIVLNLGRSNLNVFIYNLFQVENILNNKFFSLIDADRNGTLETYTN